jgi:acyl-CoA synthetase (NDP forming)
MDRRRIKEIVTQARSDGRDALLEHEGLELLAAAGIEIPCFVFVPGSNQLKAKELAALPGTEVVVKVVSPDILHKSDMGGVVFVQKDPETVYACMRSMEASFADRDLRGFLVVERVRYDPSLGGELLFGIRWTTDFGPVVVFGTGGVYAEYLSENLRPGRDVGIASIAHLDALGATAVIGNTAVAGPATGTLRGQHQRIDMSTLVDMLLKFGELASETMPAQVSELEVNPFVIRSGRLIPLDVLARCEPPSDEGPADRPTHKLERLFKPRSMAFVGVSERMNPGRLSLVNTLRAGFDPQRIYVVKPETQSIEGCACYPDLDSLPEAVDHLVLAVSASQLPDILSEVIDKRLAESVLLIPGGLDEKTGAESIVGELKEIVQRSRASDWGGPLLVGANSMGIRSQPGRYDTMFLPDYKLPMSSAPAAPVAFISQSGAFYGAAGGKLGLAPRYAISVGNQTDLTIGDYLMHLKEDPQLEVFAVYAEGFQPLDGLRFLEAARQITAQGRAVILYRAGRTAEGRRASASHTASLAGDYPVARELARQAGVTVCETTADFEDLVKLFTLLRSCHLRGSRLGAVSNAGFECVSISDHLDGLRLAELSSETMEGLRSLLAESRLDQVVDARNPVDVTPIMPDAPFEAAVRLVMGDDNVDVVLVGCVPLSPALSTLPQGTAHEEDIHREDSIVMRLVRLKDEVSKPWVVAVDGGPLFDPMAQLLEAHGIPTFRTADRALRLLDRYCGAKLGR